MAVRHMILVCSV